MGSPCELPKVSGRVTPATKYSKKGHLSGLFFWRGSESFGKNGVQNDDDVNQVCLFLGIRIVENPRKVSILLPN